ncbi:MAG: TMEM165/GDT1 family protein [Myxococcales bacterium]|nr:TMEM165/GDT1 family protein [Myxococcales bacterium]
MSLAILLKTFGLIFLAEMGDKTQIVSMLLATRFDWKKAFAGIALAFALINLLAVAVGQVLFNWIDVSWVRLGAGALFVFFGVTTLRHRNDAPEEEAEGKGRHAAHGPILTAFLMILLAEMGDKTQLMSATLAAQYSGYVAVFIGSTLALWLVALLGMGAGVLLLKKVPLSLVKTMAGGIFLAFGVVSLVQGATLRGWLPCAFESSAFRSILC